MRDRRTRDAARAGDVDAFRLWMREAIRRENADELVELAKIAFKQGCHTTDQTWPVLQNECEEWLGILDGSCIVRLPGRSKWHSSVIRRESSDRRSLTWMTVCRVAIRSGKMRGGFWQAPRIIRKPFAWSEVPRCDLCSNCFPDTMLDMTKEEDRMIRDVARLWAPFVEPGLEEG